MFIATTAIVWKTEKSPVRGIEVSCLVYPNLGVMVCYYCLIIGSEISLQTAISSELFQIAFSLTQGCSNPRRLVSRTAEFCK